MGQKLTTPLSLTLGHWKEVKDRANNLSVEVRRKKWQTLCSSEWPTLDVGWPQDGTFNIDCILQVKEQVFDTGPHGHSDQVPYVITWESLLLQALLTTEERQRVILEARKSVPGLMGPPPSSQTRSMQLSR